MTDLAPLTAAIRTHSQDGPAVRGSQAGQTSNQDSRGHIFGDTIVQDQASAHFGDSYTSYHIYNTSDRASSTTISALTIGDALTGILAASTRAIASVSTLSNPSPTLREIQEELINLRIILSSLQRFVDHGSSVSSERASLIELEDVVTVMTQLVLLYSEFEEFLAHYLRRNRRKGAVFFFAGKPARLLSGLQRHKSTLSIILHILQCRFNLEAQNQAVILNLRTEHELESDPALAQRLLHLEPIEDAGEDAASTIREPSKILRDTNAVKDTNHSLLSSGTHVKSPAFLQRNVSKSSTTNDIFYGVVVAQSRVYRRVAHREIDAVSIGRSSRSRGWSILSGLSASQVTCVGVINLPLNVFELVRFRNHLPPHGVYDSVRGTGYPLPATKPPEPLSISQNVVTWPDMSSYIFERAEGQDPPTANFCHHLRDSVWCAEYGVNTYPWELRPENKSHRGCHKRLRTEWIDFGPDYPEEIRASPVGDGLTYWQATIKGPRDTPFEGGTFLLRIRYPPLYPFEPPRYTFMTKVYHPNIDDAGNISMNLLGSHHTPAMTTPKMLLSISSFLDDPNVEQPLMPEIAHVYKNDKAAYDRTAREWTRLYAKGSQTSRIDEDWSKFMEVDEPQPADAQDHTPTRKCHRVVEVEPDDTLDLATMRQCHRIVEIETV